jgi:two-component system NtrC family sensor kinase
MSAAGRFWNRISGDLAVKLSFWLVVTTTLVIGAFSYWNLESQKRQSERIVLEGANRISELMRSGTRHQMLRNDREALAEFIRSVGSVGEIRRIRIINKEGRIRFSTNQAEVDTQVDKSAEACFACHSREEPLRRLDRPDRARIFRDASGGRVLGLIQPIENEPACSTGACHYHPPGQNVLGVIDTDLSLESADAELAAQQTRLLALSGFMTLFVCLASTVFVWAVIRRPVRRLIAGTRRVAAGDLDHRLGVASHDELGQLAESFNRMTAGLKTANAEITAWTRTLEQRVEEKTAELRQLYQSLLATEKMASLGKLAATVAHEVNNPLFGILTYARLISKEINASGLDDGVKATLLERVRIIEREIHRCGQLIRNLLTFARQAPPERKWEDLNALIGRALTLVSHQCGLQGIEVRTDLQPDAPQVRCDAGQIQQVVLVLLANAIEAMGTAARSAIRFRPTEARRAGARPRQRLRYSGGRNAAAVRPVFHDQGGCTKHGSGTGHRPQHCRAARRLDFRRIPARRIQRVRGGDAIRRAAAPQPGRSGRSGADRGLRRTP